MPFRLELESLLKAGACYCACGEAMISAKLKAYGLSKVREGARGTSCCSATPTCNVGATHARVQRIPTKPLSAAEQFAIINEVFEEGVPGNPFLPKKRFPRLAFGKGYWHYSPRFPAA